MTSKDCVVGVDVGGSRKGFHAAVWIPGTLVVHEILWADNASELCRELSSRELIPSVIAIDCPPRASRRQAETRLAERQLTQRGFRMQWTRHESMPAAEWMTNGERLWDGLRTAFPEARMVETFPTAASPLVADSPLVIPLRLFAPFSGKREWKDFVDACICADVGRRILLGHAHVAGLEDENAEADELGPIYY